MASQRERTTRSDERGRRCRGRNALAASLAAQTRLEQEGPVQISGVIRGIAGKGLEPLLGIPVYLTRLPDSEKETVAVNRLAVTDAAGRYSFDKLVAGRYRVCPHSPRSVYLSPCDWAALPPVVLANALGNQARNQQLTEDFLLETGVIVNITVQDEDGELTKAGLAHGVEIRFQGPRGEVTVLPGAQFERRQQQTIVVPKGRATQMLVKTAGSLQVDTDDQGSRQKVSAETGLAVAIGQEPVREVRLFVRGGAKL